MWVMMGGGGGGRKCPQPRCRASSIRTGEGELGVEGGGMAKLVGKEKEIIELQTHRGMKSW